MTGTVKGAARRRLTIIEKRGSEAAYRESMQEVGRKGGRNGTTGGFAANKALARIAGAKGGRISRRGPAKQVYN